MNNFEKLIIPIIEDNGCEFYDSEVVTEGESKYFRIYVTNKNGVNVDHCAKISRLISPILDVEEPVSGKYFFEVSSPGIERKLTKIEHFKKSIGINIKVKLQDNSKKKGIITTVNGNIIELEVDGCLEKIEFADVKTAKTQFEW